MLRGSLPAPPRHCCGRLDSVRRGFSAKWAHAFEVVGLDVVEDIAEMDDETVKALEHELKKAGAKMAHVRQRRAPQSVGC